MKFNKIEILLFLKKYFIISNNTYLTSLVDIKDVNETLNFLLKDKDMLKIEKIEKHLSQSKNKYKFKTILQNLVYFIVALLYSLLMLYIKALNIIEVKKTIIIFLISCFFGFFSIFIFKSSYKNKIKNINSELNIIKYIKKVILR